MTAVFLEKPYWIPPIIFTWLQLHCWMKKVCTKKKNIYIYIKMKIIHLRSLNYSQGRQSPVWVRLLVELGDTCIHSWQCWLCLMNQVSRPAPPCSPWINNSYSWLGRMPQDNTLLPIKATHAAAHPSSLTSLCPNGVAYRCVCACACLCERTFSMGEIGYVLVNMSLLWHYCFPYVCHSCSIHSHTHTHTHTHRHTASAAFLCRHAWCEVSSADSFDWRWLIWSQGTAYVGPASHGSGGLGIWPG